jgi:hypothetical protein
MASTGDNDHVVGFVGFPIAIFGKKYPAIGGSISQSDNVVAHLSLHCYCPSGFERRYHMIFCQIDQNPGLSAHSFLIYDKMERKRCKVG